MSLFLHDDILGLSSSADKVAKCSCRQPASVHRTCSSSEAEHPIQITPAPLRPKVEGSRCVRARRLLFKTTKEGMLIGQMGSFFYVHALTSISITTEDHSCDSSLVCARGAHAHSAPKKSILAFWFIHTHESMQRCHGLTTARRVSGSPFIITCTFLLCFWTAYLKCCI